MKVLIIGAGLSGLTAAGWLTGFFEGSGRVGMNGDAIEIELISDGSGASPYVHGLNIPLHPRDSVEAFLRDTMESGCGLSRQELAEALCRDSLALPHDLERMNIFLDRKNGEYDLLKALGSSYPRIVSSGNHTGAQIMNRLDAYLRGRKEVRFTAHTRALRLDVRNKRVYGAVLWNEESQKPEYRHASCVLIASGGYCGIYPFSTNGPESGGDGIAMAYEAGAVLTDLEFVQFEPSVAVYPEKLRGKSVITTMFYEGAVLRNGLMERFMKRDGEEGPGECVGKDVMSLAIYNEIRKGCATPHGGVYFDATCVGKSKLEKSYGSYVERYRRAGMEIDREPFEIAPGPHTSLGGILIDPGTGTAIEGLYAAGEVTGGIHGASRIGGNAGLETLVFGKRAGMSILRYMEHNRKEDAEDHSEALLAELFGEERRPAKLPILQQYRKEMQEILQSSLYIIRNGSDLQRAAERLDNMVKDIRRMGGRENGLIRLRLENDLVCASLMAHAAWNREESAGAHRREDDIGGNSRYHVLLRKGQKGLTVWKEEVGGMKE